MAESRPAFSLLSLLLPIGAMLLSGLASLATRLALDSQERERAAIIRQHKSDMDALHRQVDRLQAAQDEGMLRGARQRFEEQTRTDIRQDSDITRLQRDLEGHLRGTPDR